MSYFKTVPDWRDSVHAWQILNHKYSSDPCIIFVEADAPMPGDQNFSAPTMSLFAHFSPRQRALRRIQSASRNESESIQIRAFLKAQLESVRANLIANKYFDARELVESRNTRMKRWQVKLSSSPLGTDQVSEEDHRARIVALREAKRRRAASNETELDRRMHSAVLHASSMSAPEDTSFLRKAKRDLIYASKQLRAMKDVAKSNARIFSHNENA